VRYDQIARHAARAVQSVSNAQPRRRPRRVRVLFRERNVAGGVDGRVARPQGRIGLHAPVRYSYFGGLQPQVLYVGLPPDAQQKLVILKFPRFGLAPHCQQAVRHPHRPKFEMQAHSLALEPAAQYLARLRLVLRQ